jgi:hypothetical protein
VGTPHERTDVIARVYARHREIELSGGTPTLRGLGREFALDPTTIRRYVELGRQAEVWTVAYDRVQMTSIVTDTLQEVLSDAITDSRNAEEGKERALHRQVILAAADRLMRLHGLAAPARVHVTSDNEARPDPDLVAAVSDEIRALNEDKRRRALDPARDEED